VNRDPLHDEKDDYADNPARPYGRFDALFAGIDPIRFVFLVCLTPCYAFFPITLFWGAIGSLVCRHPAARRNAWILIAIAIAQMLAVICLVFWDSIVLGIRN
jgi:hypothetical protein